MWRRGSSNRRVTSLYRSNFSGGGGGPAAPSVQNGATWAATDQTFTDGQILDTAAEGVPTGSWTVEQSGSGSLAIVSNLLSFDADASGGRWNANYLISSSSFTRCAGRVIKVNSLASTNSSVDEWGIILDPDGSWNSSTPPATVDSILWYGADNGVDWYEPGVGSSWTIGVRAGVESRSFIIALGGHTATGLPDPTGAYGAFVYTKGGEYSDWTLVFISERLNTTPIYCALTRFKSKNTVGEIMVSQEPVASLITPISQSLFTGADGTDINGYVADTGGQTWSVDTGTATISANYASVSTGCMAVVDTGEVNVFVKAEMETVGSTFGNILLRYVDTSNHYRCELGGFTPNFEVYEVVGGTSTSIATGDVSGFAGGSLYWFSAMSAPNMIRMQFEKDNDLIMAATSATAHTTGTKQGMNVTGTGPVRFDHFTVYTCQDADLIAQCDAITAG